MLNSFDNRPATHGLPAGAAFSREPEASADAEGPAEAPSPEQGVLTRLFVRRWLILLFVAIVLALLLAYHLPWRGAFWACAVFSIGAALIPRSDLPVPALAAGQRREEPLPLRLAGKLIDALPEPAILLRQDGEIVVFNGRARELFYGLRAGAHLSSATRSPQILDAVTECSPAKPLQTVMFSDRVPVVRHMAATVSWLQPGRRTGALILVFLHDLTEQRRLDQLRADFIANASHEIKTPLASLLGFIETLQGAARHDEAARDRFLAIMAKQGARMARLIDNLMSLSQVETRAHLKPQATVTIGELVAQACDALEPMAAEANIKVGVHSGVDGAAVLGDRDELMQVFINLLHNAIKYGKPGGLVHVSLQRVQNGAAPAIEVAIEDNGPGIPRQHLPRLTERFYRVPGQSALEKGGTGLGLAIVKHVVNRHRGELRIVSEEGAGSRFTVLLAEHVPAKAADEEPH
jgi:two-component system phosphate regulon sensor histidine kinase PhoR